MTPYRTAGKPADPDLVLARISARVAGVRVGNVAVGKTTLTWEPRVGQPRQVEVGAGLAGLRLARWVRLDPPPRSRIEDGAATVTSLARVVQANLFEHVRARPNDQLIENVSAEHLGDDGERSNAGEFVGVLLDDHLVCLCEGERTWNAVLGVEETWPDASATTLFRALVWLTDEALRDVIDRVFAAERRNALQWIPLHAQPALEKLDDARRRRAIFGGSPLPFQMIRCFTREAVAARTVWRGRVHRFSHEHEPVDIEPSPAELAAIERWLAR